MLDHELTLDCDFYTPADAELIPTGEIRSVADTAFDFRKARTIRNPPGQTYDTNFVAALQPGPDGLARIATLRSPKNGLTLELHTHRARRPGLRRRHAQLSGSGTGRRALRPARRNRPRTASLPDSPNRRHFTDVVLRPEDEYHHISEFRFV